MEQKFGKNSIDIKALREFCEREGINLSTFLSDSLDDAPTEVQQEDLPF